MGFMEDVGKGVLVIAICGASYVGLSKVYQDYSMRGLDVKISSAFREHFKTNSSLKEYNLKINDITNIKTGLNQYQSLVTVGYQGEEYNVTVNVLYDGNNMNWRFNPADFSFLAQSQIEKMGKKLFEK